jgi:hypothetical protein
LRRRGFLLGQVLQHHFNRIGVFVFGLRGVVVQLGGHDAALDTNVAILLQGVEEEAFDAAWAEPTVSVLPE